MPKEPLYTARDARLSPDGVYRYLLEATWDEALGLVLWILLNPSTADARQLDPTLRRVLGFTMRWGYGGLLVANLFAFRSPHPADMKAAQDPVGPENDAALAEAARRAKLIVCGWGAHGTFRYRDDDVVRKVLAPFDLYALDVTAGGDPMHPLYQPGDRRPQLWRKAP